MRLFMASQAKARRNGLPAAVLFTKSSKTSSVFKAVSVEYRKRLLLAEVRGTKPNDALGRRFAVRTFPALLTLAGDEGDVAARFDKKPTLNKLSHFLGKHALRKPIERPAKTAAADPPTTRSSAKTEL